MQSLNPLRAAALRVQARPTIHEIAASVLHPQPNCRRCISASSKLPSIPNRPHRHRQQVASSISRTTPIASSQTHQFHTTSPLPRRQYSPHPQSSDRGPPSTESTQTDFSSLDVLGSTQAPSTAVNVCVPDGFHLSSGVKITGGAGALLVGGEAFAWKPWQATAEGTEGKKLLNGKGQWEVGDEAWGLLGVVWPKPDLLIIGVGPSMLPLSPATRRFINSLGIRVDVQDTRNASAQFNLLATERGVGSVAAALVPIGWKEGVGIVVEEDDA